MDLANSVQDITGRIIIMAVVLDRLCHRTSGNF